MKLQKISISNFRNINELEYQPKPGLNILMGDNAQGKTNILEAIFVVATASSFRTNNDRLLVQQGKEKYGLKATHMVDKRAVNTEIEYHWERGKQLRINSKKSSQNNPNRLRVVDFTPDDLYLVKGSPSRRRKYIDYILKEVTTEYRLLLDNYYKILRRRNEALRKNEVNGKSYRVISELFAEYAAKIIKNRINLVKLLDKITSHTYLQLSQDQEEIKIKYALSFPFQEDKINYITLNENLSKYLEENRENELRRKSTLVGPHLDDINIYLQNQHARLFASQGQQRNIAVSLKIAQVLAFKEIIGFYPLLLLDEVLAEFDDPRKARLLDYINRAEYQSILTSVVNDLLYPYQERISLVKSGHIL
ncbi:MAG: DNA replication and repair protein RecF [Syntrophomonadaceae bacterium]|nr:DNA replication and repair protein RecF [Syntrophomonadaceae bacterium]